MNFQKLYRFQKLFCIKINQFWFHFSTNFCKCPCVCLCPFLFTVMLVKLAVNKRMLPSLATFTGTHLLSICISKARVYYSYLLFPLKTISVETPWFYHYFPHPFHASPVSVTCSFFLFYMPWISEYLHLLFCQMVSTHSFLTTSLYSMRSPHSTYLKLQNVANPLFPTLFFSLAFNTLLLHIFFE